MSTAGGPKLHGIGRSGDSDIVLCMDAHDAGSYPGEPTTNLQANGVYTGFENNSTSGWSFDAKTNGAFSVISSDSHSGKYCAKLTNSTVSSIALWKDITITSGATYTWTVWVKNISCPTTPTFSSAGVSVSTVSGGSNFTGISDEWQRFHWTFTAGSTGTFSPYIRTASNASQGHFLVDDIQIEQKAYATPYVQEIHRQGLSTGTYAARPASVNLMIHGDVGTGQTFSDSSPSKHTITTSGNTTHSATQSKFSGGSVYFDGTGDELTLASSTDWAVGTTATIDCWVYPTNAYTTNHRLWCVNNTSYNLDGYVSSAGVFKLHGGLVVSQALPRNEWTHIAVTYTSGTIKVYFNGISQTLTGTTTGYNITNTGSYQSLHIGQFISGSYYYAGYMDEFRITKGTALWTSNFTPPTRRNLSAPVVDRSSHDNGGNFATTGMTDVATYRDGQVIEPVASAVWDFDNTDDVITLGPSSGFGITNTVSVFTWVKLDSTSGWNGVFGTYDGGNFIHFQLNSGGMNVYLYGPNIAYGSIDSESYLSAGEWTHIGFAYNSTVLTVYINGQSMPTKPTTSSTANISSVTEVSIGRAYADWRMFNGQIGNVQVYRAALTDQQIKQNFNSQRSRFEV